MFVFIIFISIVKSFLNSSRQHSGIVDWNEKINGVTKFIANVNLSMRGIAVISIKLGKF